MDGKLLFAIQSSRSERVLTAKEQSECLVVQLDTDFDGKYDTIVVASDSEQKIIDVLSLSKEGWFVHATPAVVEARNKILKEQLRKIEIQDRLVEKALKEFREEENAEKSGN